MKKTITIFCFFFLIASGNTKASEITQEQALQKVVQIFITNKNTGKVLSSGSGVIINPEKRQIATALHVVNPVASNDSKFDLYVCINEDISEKTSCYFLAKISSYSTEYDAAIIEITKAFGETGKAESLSKFKKNDIDNLLSAGVLLPKKEKEEYVLGEQMWIAGYPAAGGDTITIGTGTLSGIESGEVSYGKTTVELKTNAPANRGNSGGPAFSEENGLMGIVTSVQTDISPITYITAWPVISDLLLNGVMARPGAICPDYKNMTRKRGDCVCSEGLIWNEQKYRCETEEEARSEEETEDEENLPTPNENALDTEQQEQDTKNEEQKSPTEKDEQDTEEDPTPQKEDAFTDEEKNIGTMKTRDGIIKTILQCKEIQRYGKEAYRICFKENFLKFIRDRQKILRKANALCREELGKNAGLESVRICAKEKLES